MIDLKTRIFTAQNKKNKKNLMNKFNTRVFSYLKKDLGVTSRFILIMNHLMIYPKNESEVFTKIKI